MLDFYYHKIISDDATSAIVFFLHAWANLVAIGHATPDVNLELTEYSVLSVMESTKCIGLAVWERSDSIDTKGRFIGIEESYRGSGLFTSIRERHFELLRSKGKKSIFCYIAKTNTASITAHEKIGYILDPTYYHDDYIKTRKLL